MASNYKKIINIALRFAAVFIIAVLATVITEHYLFPYLSAAKIFSQWKILQKAAENVTIINKTEQVIVREDDSLNTIVSKAVPAVVNIISKENIRPAKTGEENFAGNFKSASGTIVTSDGLIVTYRDSIIENGASYQVLLADGSQREANLLGTDSFSNLAFLKIEASNLTAIGFADSSDFRPGKKLIAISNADGEYQNSYESGLFGNLDKTFNISGKTVSSSEKLEGVIVADFARERTFIGAPVITYSGDLAGIIGNVSSDNRENYFVIPASIVKDALNLVIQNKLNSRPVLGLYYLPVTKKLSIVNNLERDRGALIFSPSGKQSLAMLSNSPAEKAGLQIDDIIITVNNQEINLDNPLSNLISRYQKGDEVELLLIRGGKEMKMKVRL